MNTPKIKRFSLIELLVVISIICILISLISPALKGALSKARVISCATQINKLGAATFAYTEDYDGFTPIRHNGKGTHNTTWGTLISPYLGIEDYKNSEELKVFQCPSMSSTYLEQHNITYNANKYRHGSGARIFTNNDDERLSDIASDSILFLEGAKAYRTKEEDGINVKTWNSPIEHGDRTSTYYEEFIKVEPKKGRINAEVRHGVNHIPHDPGMVNYCLVDGSVIYLDYYDTCYHDENGKGSGEGMWSPDHGND